MNLNSSVHRVLLRCIQNYRKKKLHNKFNEIKSIFAELNEICADRFADDLLKDRKNIIEETFDRLTLKIKNKNVITKVKSFIDLYKKVYNPSKKIDEKIFLSLWVFSAFPDFVLEPTTEIKDKVFNISTYLVNKINQLCLDNELIMNKIFFIDLNKNINNYTEIFDQFIKEDKKIKILQLKKI